MSLPKKRTWFWLPGDLSLVPNDCVITMTHDPGINDPFGGLTAAALAAKNLKVVVSLPYTSAELLNPVLFYNRLYTLAGVLAERGLTPYLYAIAIGDENFDQCNYGVRLSWPCYAGMTRPTEDRRARKEFLLPRLSQFFAMTKTIFPLVPTAQVETMYCSDAANDGLWHPACPDADILVVDPYMPTDGWSWIPGSPALTDTTPASPYYEMNCGWLVVGTPAGFPVQITGAFVYNKPVVVVGQAFRDLSSSSLWRQMPTTSQIRWPFERFVNESRVVGLGWYALTSAPGECSALDQNATHYQTVLGTMAEMAGGTPVADPVAQPLSGVAIPAPPTTPPNPPPDPPVDPPPAPTGTLICQTSVYSDGRVVVAWPSGQTSTVMPV